MNLQAARTILGTAIGMPPKDKLFKKYIEMEMQMGNSDCRRSLHKKYCEWTPSNCYAWCKCAEMVDVLGRGFI